MTLEDGRGQVIGGSLGTFRVVARNRAIARAVLAYGGWTFADWANWLAILVYAFQLGGAGASGALAVAVLVPAAFLSPILAAYGDRMARERLLLASYVAQAVTMAAVGVAMAADSSIVVVGALGGAMVVAIGIGRPAHNALLPSLADSPEELTAANVASGTVQNAAILLAPAAAGLLLATWGPAAVFAVTSAVAGIGAVLVAGVRTERSTIHRDPADGPAGPVPGIRHALDILRRHGGSRTIVVLIAAGAVIEGALDIIAVLLALEILGLGEAGVGVLGSAVGLGGLIGAAAAATLVGRTRLGRPFLGGLVVWSIPIAIVGALPGPAIAVGLFVVAGMGRSVMDVAGRTLLQRVAPEAALGSVFGALEGLHLLMLAVGSVLVPALIALVGSRPALVATGLWLPVIALVAVRSVRAADDHAVVHVRELRRLRAVPMFAPLSPPTIERLAARLVAVQAPIGTWLIREGEPGDRYFVIDAGTAAVSIGGRVVRVLAPGDGFGEISLLRNVPRTASVRATSDVSLFGLDRSVFLAALTGQAQARSAADALVSDRLESDATELSTAEAPAEPA